MTEAKYYLIRKSGNFASIENEAGYKQLVHRGATAYRCIIKMLRKESVKLIPENHNSYDFADILYEYLSDTSEV